jgi:hypothetical protein
MALAMKHSSTATHIMASGSTANLTDKEHIYGRTPHNIKVFQYIIFSEDNL